MLFNTLDYFLFLIPLVALYLTQPTNRQNWLLLLASYFFYACWDYRFLALMIASTLVDYNAARWIGSASSQSRRKWLLAISLVVNLTFLAIFKYFNFFIDNASRMFAILGWNVPLPLLYIVLPPGISFYTFESMSYVIDIYRRKVEPTGSLLNFALFIAFFPKLVAGPIMRLGDLLPQLKSERRVTNRDVTFGCTLILTGLFRKVVIADAIGPQVDAIFANPNAFTSPELMKGLYLFALQIYCDFAGYSEIAIGSARLLGFTLMTNFAQPYFASSITEFWRRWHISLSTWLRDYLYIPLGGNRLGAWRTYRNLMVTMLLGGFWHGAAWSFVVWGALQGAYLAVHRVVVGDRPADTGPDGLAWNWRRIGGIFLTFHVVVLAWTFFRAPGAGAAFQYLQRIAELHGMRQLGVVWPSVLVPYLLMLAVDIPMFLTGEQAVVLRLPRLARHAAIAAMVLLISLGFGTRAPFIYFQF